MVATLTREAAVAALDAEIVRRSVVDFAGFLSIRSDDPTNPTVERLRLWPHQAERLQSLDAGTSEVILKARQEGFTTGIVAPYMLHRAMFRGWSVGYYSVDQQAARTQISRLRVMWSLLPRHLRVGARWTADEVHFDGGGIIRAFASTDHAGISYTFNLVVMDEAAFHPFGASNYAAFRPAVARGQVVILSTADPSLGPSGFFHDLYWASKRGETGYLAVFVAWHARPDRDAVWYARERAAYAGRPEEFDAFYPDSDAAAFVGRSGLVYPMFDQSKHVTPFDPFTWIAAKYRMGGVDFGGGDPTAVLALGVSGTRAIHQFEEFYQRGPVTVDQIGAWLMERHKIAPFHRIACDPSQGVAIASLRSAGLPAEPADNAREGIGLLASHLEAGRFTIHERNRDSIAEFAGYRWAQRTDPNDRQRYATSTPVGHHADGMDARRYALKLISGWEDTFGPTHRTARRTGSLVMQ